MVENTHILRLARLAEAARRAAEHADITREQRDGAMYEAERDLAMGARRIAKATGLALSHVQRILAQQDAAAQRSARAAIGLDR